MSYKIFLFPRLFLIFLIVQIIRSLQIYDSFTTLEICGILIVFQIVIFFFKSNNFNSLIILWIF